MALENAVGCMDNTVIGIARLSGRNSNQRSVYDGNKQKHPIQFRAFTTPAELFAHLHVLEVESRQNMFQYAGYGLDEIIKTALYINRKNALFKGTLVIHCASSWRYREVVVVLPIRKLPVTGLCHVCTLRCNGSLRRERLTGC